MKDKIERTLFGRKCIAVLAMIEAEERYHGYATYGALEALARRSSLISSVADLKSVLSILDDYEMIKLS